jgi:DNA-binding NarL/FixJ family response regulator
MNGKKRNILIYLIDDSRLIRDLATIIERKNPNVRIKTFKDATSCIMACNMEPPELIFLDYYLNYLDELDTNGDAVLRYVKEYLPQIKVVLLTNLSDRSKINELLQIGFDGLIHKGEGNFVRNMLNCIIKFTDVDHHEYLGFQN